MISLGLFLASSLWATGGCQSIKDFGNSGGSGPKGGVGDRHHPVLKAQAIITDGLIRLPSEPNSTRQLAQGIPPVLLVGNVSSNVVDRDVVVDDKNGARQEMLGFGHAWTDSAVAVFNELQPDLLDRLMEQLFGQSGNNMGMMRHTIGSSDLGAPQYSYDDNGPSYDDGAPDPTLSNFDLGPHGTAQAHMIARMGKYKGDVFLYGSPWSYPSWTKYNGLLIAPSLSVSGGGAYNVLNNSFNNIYIPTMINYFARYVDAFRELGVKVNGITLQNEPLNYQGGYPQMYLDANDAAAMINLGLGAEMRARGVKILAYDHNTDQPFYPARVRQYAQHGMDAAAWHCYQNPVANYSVLSDFHDVWPTVPQFMTECSNTAPNIDPGRTNFWVAENFIPAVQHGASGATFWVMATNTSYGPFAETGGCHVCSGSVVVNSSSEYYLTNDYYMVGQFSRYIRRGGINYNVISGNAGQGFDWTSQFWIMSVKNPDHSWAVVFLNSFGTDQNVRLSFTGSDNVWQGVIPASTVVTWLLPSDEVLQEGNGTQPASASASSACASGYGNATSSPLYHSPTVYASATAGGGGVGSHVV